MNLVFETLNKNYVCKLNEVRRGGPLLYQDPYRGWGVGGSAFFYTFSLFVVQYSCTLVWSIHPPEHWRIDDGFCIRSLGPVLDLKGEAADYSCAFAIQ